MRALHAKQMEAAHYLVENGASLVTKDVVGKRPSDLARAESEELLASLKFKMIDPVQQMSPREATVAGTRKSKKKTKPKTAKPVKSLSSERVAHSDTPKKERSKDKISHGTTR
jgi:hypothetical protein